MIGKIVEAIGAKIGLVVVPDWRAVRLDEERFLRRLIAKYEIDCILDVGANVGQYGNMLRNYVGYQGRIISFEPNPSAFSSLAKRAAHDPMWTVEQLALGAASGHLDFNAFGISELGSFHDLKEGQFKPASMSNEKLQVPIQTLDSYIFSMGDRWSFKAPFLKMDTQGYDLEVAKGGANTLSQLIGLQSEIAFQTIYADAPDYNTALKYYQDAGFVIGRLVPNHEIHFPELAEMDVIMVRVEASH
jgi:FkbM family methyltransferase